MKRRMKSGYIFSVYLIVLVLMTLGLPSPTLAAAGDETVSGTITMIPTIECIGVTATYTNDNNGNNSIVLQYRQSGTGTWLTGMDMYADGTHKQFRGSILGLTTNTLYEVRVTFTDADTVTGTNPLTGSVTTRNDNPAIGTVHTYYVSVSGNDTSGNGTLGNPWRTIQKAANTVVAGDTVYVRAGTYNEMVTITAHGTANNYISFLPYTGETVILDGNTGNLSRLFYLNGANYIRIKGFTLQNTFDYSAMFLNNSTYNIIENLTIQDACQTPAAGMNGGIHLDDGSNYNIIQYCSVNLTICNTLNHGIGIDGGALYGNVIRYNTITGDPAVMKDGITSYPESGNGYRDTDIYSNNFTGYYDDAIQLDGNGSNTRCWSNLCLGTSSTNAISMQPVANGPTYVFRNVVYDSFKFSGSQSGRIYIYHNTMYGGAYGLSQQNGGYLNNIVSKNNIYQNLTGYVYYFLDVGTGTNYLDYDDGNNGGSSYGKWNDVAYATLALWRTATGQSAHSIQSSDNKFVNPGAGDFHLQSSSPDIDKGVILPGFNDANSPWPYSGSAPDIGAYEWDSGVPVPPVLATIGSKTAHPGSQLQFTVSATDPNGDILTYSANNTPAGAVFTPAPTPTFTWTPSANQTGSYPNVRFAVSDGTFTDSEDITINVTENQAPVLTNPGNKSVNEGTALTFTVSATDPDGDSLTYSANNTPSGASINPTTGAFSWTPSYSQAGTYANVKFIASDGQLTDSENITITVNNVNRAPVLGAIGNKSVTEGQPLNFSISASDPDGDIVTYSATNTPAGASINGSTGAFTWTPTSAQVGSYTNVHFEVTDGALTDFENIAITVEGTSSNPPQSGGDGGGGGGGGGASGATSLLDSMTMDGRIVSEVLATGADQKVKIIIPRNTIVKNKNGQRVNTIRIIQAAEQISAGWDARGISLDYDIQPGGTTFDPYAILVYEYKDKEIPQGISENSLYIALWDPATREWIDLGGTADSEANTVSVQIQHLSIYALMAHIRPASFEISGLSLSPREVGLGEIVTVSIVVKNDGDLTGTYEVGLKLDNTTVQTRSVTLAGGESKTETFDITSNTAGEHQAIIGDMLATFVVKAPPTPAAFTVSELSINPLIADAGKNVDVSAIVKNTGDLAGTYQTILSVDDIAVETKEVALDGGGSLTVSFSFTADTVGQHKVSIGGLLAPFEVKSPPPLLPPPAATKVSGPELQGFSAAPSYDPATNKLAYARIVYEMNQTWASLPNTRLVLMVFRDGQFLEQIPLLTLSQLQSDGKTGELSYIPPAGWETGEYTFRVELYAGESLVQDTPLRQLTVTPESTTTVVSWKTLGIVIGAALALSLIIVMFVLYYRRDMLRDYRE